MFINATVLGRVTPDSRNKSIDYAGPDFSIRKIQATDQ